MPALLTIDRVREVVRVGDVAAREVGADRGRVLVCRRVEVRDGDVGAGLAKASSDRGADTFAAAGDEGALVAEVDEVRECG
jgi:hypothetical protein